MPLGPCPEKQQPAVAVRIIPVLPNRCTTLVHLLLKWLLSLQSPETSPQLRLFAPPCLRSATVTRHTGLLMFPLSVLTQCPRQLIRCLVVRLVCLLKFPIPPNPILSPKLLLATAQSRRSLPPIVLHLCTSPAKVAILLLSYPPKFEILSLKPLISFSMLRTNRLCSVLQSLCPVTWLPPILARSCVNSLVCRLPATFPKGLIALPPALTAPSPPTAPPPPSLVPNTTPHYAKTISTK